MDSSRNEALEFLRARHLTTMKDMEAYLLILIKRTILEDFDQNTELTSVH